MSEMKSPLARLVIFLVALSLCGGIVAGIASQVIAPPQGTVPDAPANSPYMDCVYDCMSKYPGQAHLNEYLECARARC